MMGFLATVGLFTGVFLVAFVMLNLRHIVTGKEFRGTCASASPALKNEVGECGLCGRKPGEACGNPDGAKA